MRINLAKSAGFCSGVKRALGIAGKLVESGAKVEMLGDIVHNKDVARSIYKAGIKKVKALSRGKNKIFLIRAHGTSKNIIKKARGLGYKIVDATCPMVKEIHKTARQMEQKGRRIIIIGDKAHDEVHGIAGQLQKKALVIDPLEGIDAITARKIKKAAIVVQSTQNLDNVLRALAALKPQIKNLKFFNTICAPTRLKQQEIKDMPLVNDLMIIIGSKTSANTKRLYEISKSLNKRTYWIQSKEGVNLQWFKNAGSVGVASGASTPDRTTREVIRQINAVLSPR